jgi:hypothetical protein
MRYLLLFLIIFLYSPKCVSQSFSVEVFARDSCVNIFMPTRFQYSFTNSSSGLAALPYSDQLFETVPVLWVFDTMELEVPCRYDEIYGDDFSLSSSYFATRVLKPGESRLVSYDLYLSTGFNMLFDKLSYKFPQYSGITSIDSESSDSLVQAIQIQSLDFCKNYLVNHLKGIKIQKGTHTFSKLVEFAHTPDNLCAMEYLLKPNSNHWYTFWYSELIWPETYSDTLPQPYFDLIMHNCSGTNWPALISMDKTMNQVYQAFEEKNDSTAYPLLIADLKAEVAPNAPTYMQETLTSCIRQAKYLFAYVFGKNP